MGSPRTDSATEADRSRHRNECDTVDDVDLIGRSFGTRSGAPHPSSQLRSRRDAAQQAKVACLERATTEWCQAHTGSRVADVRTTTLAIDDFVRG
jgi:hypothetical protein